MEVEVKNGKPRCHTINTLTVEDSVLLRSLVDEHVPAGTSAEASLIISRLISNACQRERFIGRLEQRIVDAEARAKQAENTVRSMIGNGEDVRVHSAFVIKHAVAGAKAHARTLFASWLRARHIESGNDPRNHLNHLSTDAVEALAEAVERGEYEGNQ